MNEKENKNLENLHWKDVNTVITGDSDDFFDETLDEIAEILSNGYEDIRTSNPNILENEHQIEELIAKILGEIIRDKSVNTFEQSMILLACFQGEDAQIDALLLAARLMQLVPNIVTSIQEIVASHFDVSDEQQQIYNDESQSMKRLKKCLLRQLFRLMISTQVSGPIGVKELESVHRAIRTQMFKLENCPSKLALFSTAIVGY